MKALPDSSLTLGVVERHRDSVVAHRSWLCCGCRRNDGVFLIVVLCFRLFRLLAGCVMILGFFRISDFFATLIHVSEFLRSLPRGFFDFFKT